MQPAVPLASAVTIAVIEVISNHNAINASRRNTMPSMLIVIRNPKAIEVEAAVVDEVHLVASVMENRATMTGKHSVPYLAASHIAARQRPTYRFERSMESGSRTVVQHITCITIALYL